MPKMHISRSIKIDAPADKVYSVISDFHQWRAWSPWLITEPETEVNIAEDGSSYDWKGKRTGEGKMAIRESVENKSLDLDLNFLKPWKSYADTRFSLTEDGGSTNVTWVMDSSLPFFLFFMKKMMVAMIGMDYDKGLMMLKSYVETGSVPSKLDFVGVSDFPGGKFVGIKTDCSMSQIGPAMEKDFGKLMEVMESHQDLINGKGFSIYHKWDFGGGKVSYTAGIQVSKLPQDLPSGVTTGEIPPTQVQVIRHTGPYQYLGNAWSTVFAMQQAKEIKPNKKIHPFEIYMNMPGEVPDEELVTEVNFPIK